MTDYKELIERLNTDAKWAEGHEWDAPICLNDDLSAAITMISTLTEENAQLRAELKQVKRERDAAVADLNAISLCPYCKYWSFPHGCKSKKSGTCTFEWRGPRKEE